LSAFAACFGGQEALIAVDPARPGDNDPWRATTRPSWRLTWTATACFFPDVPGCTSGGATVPEAARNAEEALQAHLELLRETSGALPDPSELNAARAEPGVKEHARLLVRFETDPPPRFRDSAPATRRRIKAVGC
jgi:predicted RNase H-like HicB family nuclease